MLQELLLVRADPLFRPRRSRLRRRPPTKVTLLSSGQRRHQHRPRQGHGRPRWHQLYSNLNLNSAASNSSLCSSIRACVSKKLRYTAAAIDPKIITTTTQTRAMVLRLPNGDEAERRGWPHLGQVAACKDTSCPHEGQGIRFAMPPIVGVRQSPASPRSRGRNRCKFWQGSKGQTTATNRNKISVGPAPKPYSQIPTNSVSGEGPDRCKKWQVIHCRPRPQPLPQMVTTSLSASVLPNKIQKDPCRARPQ